MDTFRLILEPEFPFFIIIYVSDHVGFENYLFLARFGGSETSINFNFGHEFI